MGYNSPKELVVVLDEVPKRESKALEFVIYQNAEYRFHIIKEALPYYDKFYTLLQIMGVEY